MSYTKDYKKNMESLSIVSNIHSSIRNSLFTLSIAYIIMSALSNNFIKNKTHILISRLLSSSFVLIGIIICFFSIQNIFENKKEYPEIFKWIIPHIIILIMCLIILSNKIIYTFF